MLIKISAMLIRYSIVFKQNDNEIGFNPVQDYNKFLTYLYRVTNTYLCSNMLYF